MAAVVTVTTATDMSLPNVVNVTGLAAGINVITMRRTAGDEVAQPIGGAIVVTGGAASLSDYLYPLDVPVTYDVYDSTGQTPLGSATSAPVPSGGMPWIRDAVFPALHYAPVIIVDVTDRVRAGRISPFYVSATPGALTSGDVRSLSNGTLTLFCRSHAERDTVLDSMSTGAACQLRVPAACQSVVDEMLFAPVDIGETRYGVDGACLLSIDFIEVDPSELATFKPVTYGVQTQNAFAAGNMRYGKLTPPPATGLSLEFVGKTYRDMYLSATGIEP